MGHRYWFVIGWVILLIVTSDSSQKCGDKGHALWIIDASGLKVCLDGEKPRFRSPAGPNIGESIRFCRLQSGHGRGCGCDWSDGDRNGLG